MSDARTTTDDEALIVAYVDGDLDLAAAAEFEQRLASEPHLEAALRVFLAADDLGQQLGQCRLLPVARRRVRRTAPALALVTVAAAAALVLWLALPPKGTEPVASFLVADVIRATERNGAPTSALKFRVRVNCKHECYVLLLAVSSTESSVGVQQLHPRTTKEWVQDPLPIDVDVALPPPLEGKQRNPFVIPARGLVVLCTKADGPFSAEAIADVVTRARAASHNVSHRLGQASPAEREVLLSGIRDAIRTSGREGWEISFQDVVGP